LVQVGVAGELYIGGEKLARGYVGRPELTAERFVPNPYGGKEGERMYRTGDVVRWRREGKLEYLGRVDHQVKVRGYRIELGEIETVLESHEGVERAVVVAKEEAGGDKRLVGYVVKRAGAEVLEMGQLREHVREQLPEYMVPAVLMELEKLPLSPNGKIGRKSLPEPGGEPERSGREYVEAKTAAERLLAELWSELLRVKRVGVRDNFFELGGHSLLATQMISRLRKALQMEVPLRRVLESPTIEGLVQVITELTGKRETVEEIAEAYLEIAQLQEDEVKQLLVGQES
jgi:acyl carrier protein